MPVRDHDSDQDIHDDSHIQPYNGVENSVEGPTNKVKLLETQGESPLPAALEPTEESWLSTVDSQETSTPVSPEQQATKEAHKAAPYTHDTSMPKTFDVPSNDYSARLHDEYSQFQYTTQQRPQPSTMRQPNVDRPPIDQPHPQQRQIPHRKMTAQPQRYRPTPSAPAKTVMPLSFKTLWGKVERKLDGLEGAVKHQAQRLASKTPKVTSSIADRIPSGSIPLPRKSRRSVTMTPATSVPLKPYGQKYQIAREANQRQKDAKNNVMPGTKKTSDWNTLVMSSGGATPPNGGGHPLSNGNKANGPLLTPGATGPSFSTASMSSEQRYGTPPVSERPRAETSLSGSYGQGIPTSFQSHGQADSSSHSGNSPTQKQLPRAFASSSAAASQQIQAMPPSAPNRFVPDDDDTDDGPGLKHFLGRLVPPIPRFGKLFRFRFGVGGRDRYQYASMDAWKVDEEEEDGSNGFGLFGLFRKKKRQSASLTSTKAYLSNDKSQDAVPPSISRMLSRCDNAQTTSLLQHSDVRASRFIGRYQAILDVAFLLLIMLGLQQMSGFEQLLPLPKTWDDIVQVTIPKFGSILNETMMGTWAFFAFLYAYLSSYAREVLLRKKIERLSLSVAECVNEESEYSQLYLRLVAAIPFQENLPSRLAMMAKTQIRSTASKARLDSYVTIVLASLIIMTISVVIPMLTSIFSACVHILMLEEFRNWPVPWKAALDHIGMLLKELFLNLESLGAKELKELFAHPKQFAFHAAMFASFVGCSLLPRLEEKRIIKAASTSDDEDDFSDEMASSNMESAEEWSRLGMSSASRLTMLSEHGSVETALERWRASRAVAMAASSHRGPPLLLILRLVGYTVLAALLAVLPLVVSHYVVGKIPSLSSLPVPRWDSMVDLTFLQVFLFVLTHRALRKVLESTDHVSFVKQFLTDLAQTKDEMKESNKRQGDVQVMASISASAGLIVRDLWSAHTTKRAWAVRGASLQCKNGEVLAILGDDGEGKTRLLTTLAESLMFPPKRSLTTNKVRGYIAVGGLEASKWDRKLLKRRMGVLLSDVRMTADSASLFSGWTMEEILEPVDGVRSNHQGDPLQRKLTPAEKSSMLLALKVRARHEMTVDVNDVFAAHRIWSISNFCTSLVNQRSLVCILHYCTNCLRNSQPFSRPMKKICVPHR
jgi:ABC-type multidrug transport system fused ATPase/permease subunit